MSSWRKMFFFGLIACSGLLFLTGCGGGGGSSTPNPFAGSYVVDVFQDQEQVAKLGMTVAANGAISMIEPENESFSGSGSVSKSGEVQATFRFTEEGRQVTGQIIGMMTKTGDTVTGSGTFTLSDGGSGTWQVSGETLNPFAGRYNVAAFSNGQQIGTAVIVIGVDGEFTISAPDDPTMGGNGVVTVAGDVSGTIYFTPDGATSPAYGTMTGKLTRNGNTVTGSGTMDFPGLFSGTWQITGKA